MPEDVKLDGIKQCLNYEHCYGFAGCAKDSTGKIITGYLTYPDLCTHCDHWQELVEMIDDPQIYSIRIEGRHYQTHKNSLFRKPGKYNGFGGRKFIIHMFPTESNTDGHTFDTHNLWSQGIIPDHFKDKLPNNASFINEVTEAVAYDGEEFVTCFNVGA